jgi:hypothetical protein
VARLPRCFGAGKNSVFLKTDGYWKAAAGAAETVNRYFYPNNNEISKIPPPNSSVVFLAYLLAREVVNMELTRQPGKK